VCVKVASMHFEGPAAHWLQSVDHKIHCATWSELCSWIDDSFGRDRHVILIRQLYHIKQLGSVKDYIDRFSELVNQLQVYSHSVDPLYYTTKFVDGLRDNIKSTVVMQRPTNLDTTYYLALLQEESSVPTTKEFRTFDSNYSKSLRKGPLPLPPPPE
jgi:hypothetical protein